jgi:site-specific DNA-methyltransferase (adenine-specific)
MKQDILHGDCLELMKDISDGSIDMILCDLPYGTTACKWDTIIPFDKLWEQYERIIKPNGAIVLTASQPFTSKLVMSNIKMFRYEWIWDKIQPSGQMTAKYMPMKVHENICVFYKSKPIYNRQFTKKKIQDLRINAVKNKNNQKNKISHSHLGGVYNKYANDYNPYFVNPKSIIDFTKQPDRKQFLHPTQKPVALFEYLIKTYTNEGDLVLDNCAGSGTTAIACLNTNRQFIVMEKKKEYFDIINKRVSEHTSQQKLFN